MSLKVGEIVEFLPAFIGKEGDNVVGYIKGDGSAPFSKEVYVPEIDDVRTIDENRLTVMRRVSHKRQREEEATAAVTPQRPNSARRAVESAASVPPVSQNALTAEEQAAMRVMAAVNRKCEALKKRNSEKVTVDTSLEESVVSFSHENVNLFEYKIKILKNLGAVYSKELGTWFAPRGTSRKPIELFRATTRKYIQKGTPTSLEFRKRIDFYRKHGAAFDKVKKLWYLPGFMLDYQKPFKDAGCFNDE